MDERGGSVARSVSVSQQDGIGLVRADLLLPDVSGTESVARVHLRNRQSVGHL